MIIKNRCELLSHGYREGREVALNVIEYAIEAVDAYEATRRRVRIENGVLTVGNLYYDLSKLGNLYLIGGGKASFYIAKALDEILGERIKRGSINVKRGERRRLRHVKVVEAGHPLPDEMGLQGAEEILSVAREAGKGDLVFCAITGGASALMPLPAEGISLENERKVSELLLNCGASIDEVNTVRKHISAIKGGRLAEFIHPAEIINLIVIDEVAGRPWGPTVPDETTFEDAVKVLRNYGLWVKVPNSVREHLEEGLRDPSLETPKLEDFKGLKVHDVILADNTVMCDAAKKRGEELGFNSLILSSRLEGESREAGVVLATIAREVDEKGGRIRPPCILIFGGETTVTITGQSGEGGPSQELVLGASLKISGSKRIVFASVDTDGTDGPTEIAGGIVDGYTLERAEESGLDVFASLMRHNSSEVLIKLQDAIITGPTGTNVMDLNIIVITS